MMKKLLALCLVLLLLTGCVAQPDTTVATDPTETAVSTEPTAAPTEATDPTEPTEPAQEEGYPTCAGHDSDPYVDVDVEAFYANYTTACCYVDACYRTAHYLMSGSLEVPGQYAEVAQDQPMEDGLYIRNTDQIYVDENTYVLVDSQGNFVTYIFKGAAYITLEEVAAYMYAFGGSSANIPANYTASKPTTAAYSEWGRYLRGNHTNFSGNTSKYPYEPALPNISGNGGNLQYYEMDIGTTGTDCGNYPIAPYNDGGAITRGSARLIYARCDLNGDGEYSTDEIYVFYTANHYNDFQEYLNYSGGWGQIFGNITGGGTLSSKKDYNPTPYVPTAYASFLEMFQKAA